MVIITQSKVKNVNIYFKVEEYLLKNQSVLMHSIKSLYILLFGIIEKGQNLIFSYTNFILLQINVITTFQKTKWCKNIKQENYSTCIVNSML